MRAYEHRAIGDAATGGALVDLGRGGADDPFLLTFGDVVALSGDFFRPDGHPGPGHLDPTGTGRLFTVAARPGDAGTRVDTRDEIVCAIKVAAVDEEVVDRRFEPGGSFAGFRFSPAANRSDVERQVRDRYLLLAANNDDHFAAPGRSDAPTGSGFGSALAAYHHLHHVALDHAYIQGRHGADVGPAMAREAASQHYLTDAFAAGHLRTPVASIRRYWKARYPGFWTELQRRVASDTAAALRELSLLVRLLPHRFVYQRTLGELSLRTGQYPELSMGDLVARAFHDWDNTHGLHLDGGGLLFGDGHLDEGDTRTLALAAARAGIDDVEVAFGIGASGVTRHGERLYEAVREATGAAGAAFVAEELVPRPASGNPPQNWRAPDAVALWEAPMVGSGGTTVGEALTAMLEPNGQFIRQVESLGEGLAGGDGVFAVPVLGSWLAAKCCHAFHDGFAQPLARDPHGVLLDLANRAGGSVPRVPAAV